MCDSHISASLLLVLTDQLLSNIFIGRDEIRGIVTSLSVAGGDSIIDQAHAFYKVFISSLLLRFYFILIYY